MPLIRKNVVIQNEIFTALQRKKGSSELFISVSKGNFRPVRAMIQSGADLNAPQTAAGDTLIHAAIASGNICMVRELIQAGADLNVIPKSQAGPLGYAISLGRLEIVKALVENGANIRATYKEGERAGGTTLHISADFGFAEICKYLIEQGIDLNTRNKNDKTPLHIAVISGKAQVVRLLLAKGADLSATCTLPESTDQDVGLNVTPVFLAAYFNHLDIVDMLIKAGADLNVKTSENYTVLQFPAQNGSVEMVNMLLKAGAGSSINVGPGSNPPLTVAAKHGHVDVVEALLQVEGIDVNPDIASGMTPLLMAVWYGHLKVVQLLIANGALVNCCTSRKQTPLLLALLRKEDIMAEVLIEHGADIFVANSTNVTPLHNACESGISLRVIKSLVKKGAKVDARTAKGETPLHLAAERGCVEVVKFLVDSGADPDVTDKDKWTPLHYAADSGSPPTVVYLGEKVAEIDALSLSLTTPLHCAIYRGHLEIVQILLKKGANLNAQDDIKCTPLHIAVENEQLEIAELLLKYKAFVNLKDKEGCTPLFLAVTNNNENLVSLLLDKGASVNTTNKYGILPIHVAANAKNTNIVKALLIKGAYFDVKAQLKNFLGAPLKFAQMTGNSKLIVILELIRKLFGAVRKNNTDLVECAVQAGAIVNARSASGRTALHYAVNNLNIHTVRALLAGDVDLGLATNKGVLPLHIAVANGCTDILEALLAYAKNLSFSTYNSVVNARSKDGTALLVAAERNRFCIVKLLLASGAAYNVKNSCGKTPLELTADQEIKSLLISTEKLFEAVKKNGLEEVMQLLESDNCAVNAREAVFGTTPLHWSISEGDTNIANALLSSGVDYCLVSNEGETALHVAASEGNVEIVELLIKRFKDGDEGKATDFLNAATISGVTALHVASNLEVAKCLLQAGAVYNIRNSEGKTALEQTQNDDVRRLLHATHQMFDDVKSGATMILDTLNNLETEEFKAVTSARNAEGQSLVQVLLANAHIKIASKLLKKLR